MSPLKFIVLGAGASGLFFSATREGQGKTLLLERQAKAGRKLLLSGGGKCNISNRQIAEKNYLCSQTGFCAPALRAFPPKAMVDFLTRHGIKQEEREHGQIFCRRSAEEVRNLLLRLAEKNGAELRASTRLEAMAYRQSPAEAWRPLHIAGEQEPQKDSAVGHAASGPAEASSSPMLLNTGNDGIEANCARFRVRAGGETFFSENLLLATGGAAWPAAGSSRSGYRLAQAFGHGLQPLRPALTPLRLPPGGPLLGLQGLSLTAEVSIPQRPEAPAFTLPLLFTHEGLSGPACLQISSYLRPGETLRVDFLPGQRLESALQDQQAGKATLHGVLRRLLPVRLAAALLNTPTLHSYAGRKAAELPKAIRLAVAAIVHEYMLIPETPGFSRAESTVGGVDTRQVNPQSMQSKIAPGLYFSGELLDVCGQLGGYNLHWAWASAWAAGHCPP